MPGQPDPGRDSRALRPDYPTDNTPNAKEKTLHLHPPKAREGHPQHNGNGIPDYEQWTWDQLMKRARNIGVQGRSSMSKDQLIRALRTR